MKRAKVGVNPEIFGSRNRRSMINWVQENIIPTKEK
jgi:hypothetical protein